MQSAGCECFGQVGYESVQLIFLAALGSAACANARSNFDQFVNAIIHTLSQFLISFFERHREAHESQYLISFFESG